MCTALQELVAGGGSRNLEPAALAARLTAAMLPASKAAIGQPGGAGNASESASSSGGIHSSCQDNDSSLSDLAGSIVAAEARLSGSSQRSPLGSDRRIPSPYSRQPATLDQGCSHIPERLPLSPLSPGRWGQDQLAPGSVASSCAATADKRKARTAQHCMPACAQPDVPPATPATNVTVAGRQGHDVRRGVAAGAAAAATGARRCRHSRQ